MPHDRYYLNAPLTRDNDVMLEGDESHHLQNVMRKRVGEEVEIVNGKGSLAKGVVKRLEKSKTLIDITSVEELSPLPTKLTLALALTVPSHLEWAIEKGTELGVTSFLLFPGDLSQKKQLAPTQRQRLEKITIAAMKQCGRGDLPSLQEWPPLKEWSSLSSPLFFGDLGGGKIPTPLPSDLTFAVGPEGGWSLSERERLIQLGGCPLSLHPYILRAETAAVVAASLFLTYAH